MKKRILSILLLCCMVLTLLPTTAFAAETGAMDTIPAKFDVEIDLCGRTKDININDSKTYYIYSSSSDPDFVWTKKIQINGKKAAPHIFLDNVNIQVKKDAKTPAIELHGKASAYLYFINRDSKLTGATGRAAIQKNRSEGQLCVQVMEGTTVTCQGGYKAAGIGGSWATRNIAESLFNLDMYGHGANMHFGSQTNPSLWSGTIIAKGGDGGAGIGGGRNGSGEKLYFYSGKIEAKGGEAASGIGGSFKGRGRDIYIYGGDISAKGGDGGAGIGGGCWKSLQDMDGDTAAYNINIYGGKINAHGGYNGAGIGGGQYVPARDITITGGEITAHGTHGAAIGGGRWCHGQNITVTDAKLKLTTGYSRYISDEAAAMGYGDRVYLEKVYDIDVGKRYIGDLVRNPLPEDYKSIKIGSYHGKLVKLKVEAQAINRDDEFALFWNLYDILIPNENGRIDVQLLTLPYVKNYGWAIEAMEMELIDDPCNGKHDFGWVDRQSCHVWACRNMKCQARDPVAEMSKQNGKHIPGDWGNQKQLCTVCGHVIGTDTKAPVLEVLKDGESYTVEDNINGNPGAYTFTVSDPAASGEASSGIKSVTINGKEQTGPTYRLPAPDGGNNDAGNEYTVVATDNAGNETTATVRTYRRHHVKVISPDGKKTYADLMLPHNEYLVLQIRLPAGVSATLTDQADGTEIPYDKENGEFRAGLITKSRTLVLNYSTKHPKVELRLGTGQYFTGYNADSDEPYYLKGASMDENSYQIGMWVDTDAKPGYYLSSPERYTQEELAALDESLWKEYKIAEATPGSIVLPFILITIDAAAYEENGGWYVYAKATNPTGTTYVSTPKMIIDVENPKAIDFSTGKELVSNGKYWGDLRFTVEDSSPVTVRHYTSPGGTAELLTPDEKGVYTISAEYDGSTQHMLVIEDACGNTTSYKSFKVCWNYLINVREKDHWDAPPAQPIRISREQNLKEELSKVQIGVFAADTSGFIPVDVSWKIPDDYDPQSRREQTFTVLGTVVLKGTGARCPSGLDVVPRPGEEWKKNISVQVTVEGEPQYKVTVQDCENGRVKVVNAAGTAEDGTPLFCKDELVMLSIAPDEGYMLSTLSVNSIPATVAAGEDTYTFTQPEGDVTITAAFEMRNEHTVTFDAGGGSEPEELPEEVTTAMPAKKILHGSEYSLPECEFIAPEGKQFKAWEIDGAEYPVNAPVTVTADITVKALWEDAPPAPAEYAVTVTSGGNGTASASHETAVVGTEITLTATPNTDYRFKEWQVMSGGVTITDNKFIMPEGNVEVKAIFEEDAPAPAEYTVTVTSGGNGMASASPAKAVAGTEITLTAKPDEGYRFKEWQVISGGVTIVDDKFTMPEGNVEVKAIFEEDAPPAPTEFTITVKTDGNGTASASPAKAAAGTQITLAAKPDNGYHFKEWQVISGGVTIENNKFIMPDSDVEVKAIFEEDAPPAPTNPAKPNISVTGTYTYNGSVHTATVNGYDSTTMNVTGNTGTDAGDYTVSVTSKTGKWADGSTEAVTAEWSIGRALQEIPIGLSSVAPSTEGGSDGKITGVTDEMEYRMADERIYTACSGTEIENLSAGHYFVRYAENNNHFASSDAAITVGEGTPLADCTITFNGNGGSGSMDSVTVKVETNYILPVCGFTAPTDQQFKAWEISGTEYKVGDSYTVNRDTEIKALWENSVITPTTYAVTVSNDGNGTGTATPSAAAAGTEITLAATPNKGYHFKEWQVISGGVTIENNRFTMPDGNVEVKAVFEEDVPAPTEFTITVKTDGNGTASTSHAKAATGTAITLTATPNKGYHFKEWQVISGGVTIENDKFTMPSANVEVKAIFEKDAPTEFTITFDGNGGTPSVGSRTTTNQKLTSLPSASRSGRYNFDGWYTKKSGGTEITTDTEFFADTTVYAHWTYTGSGGGSGYSYYTIKATAGAGGSISPSGNVSVREGRDQTFTITPDKGYAVANVKIDGKSIGAVKSYTFENVRRTHTIEVIFMKANGNPQTGVFVDVATGSYYEDAVDWAVENGITQGTDDTHFSPDGICTRAQAVTFLWRTAGSPASKTHAMPFTDVPVGSYYYDAVLWAVENGITKGTSDTTFSPNMTCTRAQIVTFLWRSEKSPAAGTANPFADVKSTAYYADAVLWAVKENITKGTTSTTFSPNADCTRAQIVTFLWRCKK
ncbi:MAG: S-layer homology domain-containing protein [Clostridiaceae bacterium]|nr:MAG: S-layer homology domain-containing protein [Clostridiaceae bacterium]